MILIISIIAAVFGTAALALQVVIHLRERKMIQSHDNRVEALRSVIPLLDIHLDLLSRVKSALGGAWQSEPSPLDVPPKPKLPTPDMFCSVDCAGCEDAVHCAEEAWVLEGLQLRHRYKLDSVTEGLEALSQQSEWGEADWGQIRAQAVYWEYIDPWTSWNPRNRWDWAEVGLSFMADTIPGPLVPFRIWSQRTGKLNLNDEIVKLREEAGYSFHQIAKTLNCSKSTVNKALAGKKVRPRHGDERDSHILQLIGQGYTWARVCQELRCSMRDISAVVTAAKSTVSV